WCRPSRSTCRARRSAPPTYQSHHGVKDRYVGGADLLALHVERAIAHWQRIDDIRRSNNCRRERLIEMERLGFVDGHNDMTDPIAFIFPAVRILRLHRG